MISQISRRSEDLDMSSSLRPTQSRSTESRINLTNFWMINCVSANIPSMCSPSDPNGVFR